MTPDRVWELATATVGGRDRKALPGTASAAPIDCREPTPSSSWSGFMDRPPEQLGRFEILRVLGAGGMGIVFEGRDDAMDRSVAVKLMLSGAKLVHRERLRREARALARLDHPNIVKIFDLGEVDGLVYLAMELVDGPTLEVWERQPRPLEELLEMYIQAGRGLAAAHEVGLVHRDFKPSNVLIGPDGRPRVVDFGLVHQDEGTTSVEAAIRSAEISATDLASHGSADVSLTKTGRFVGTPAYMAPEQFGHDRITAAADQFAFCVALFEAAFFRSPFPGDTWNDRASYVLSGKVQPIRARGRVERKVARILKRGLRAHPARRWPSMNVLLSELDKSRRRNLHVVPAVGLVSLGLGAGMGAQSMEPEPCTAAGERAAAVWSQGRAQALEERLSAAKVDGASAVVRRLDEQLGPYVEAWMTARVEACQEFRAGGLPAQVHDAQVACLEREIGTVAATVEAVAGEEREIEGLRSAVMAMEPVADPGFCRGIGAGEDVIRPPAPGIATAVFELRRDIELCRAGTRERDASVLDGVCAGLVGRAERLEYGPVLAEALVAVGEAELFLADAYEDSSLLLQRGYAAALREKDDSLSTRAASRLAYLYGYGLARFDDAERWLKEAEAGLQRLPTGGPLLAVVLFDTGMIRAMQNRFGEAADSFKAAVRAQEDFGAVEDAHLVSIRNALGASLRMLERYEEAEYELRRAEKLALRLHGPTNAKTAMVLRSRALLERARGDDDRADALFRRVHKIRNASLPPGHLLIGYSKYDLALVAARDGDPRSALKWGEEALEIVESSLGAEHVDVTEILGHLGAWRYEVGDDRGAQSAYARRQATLEAILGADHPLTVSALADHRKFRAALREKQLHREVRTPRP